MQIRIDGDNNTDRGSTIGTTMSVPYYPTRSEQMRAVESPPEVKLPVAVTCVEPPAQSVRRRWRFRLPRTRCERVIAMLVMLPLTIAFVRGCLGA